MVKVALLIAVSEYEFGLSALPGSRKDIYNMERVLKDPNMGEFDSVNLLLNPDIETMQIEIERLFAENRQKDDLVLFYFSGHGIQEENTGNLFFATRNTRQNQQGDILTGSAVPAQTIQSYMNRSNSRRQVLILDCCFSGAFANDLTATGRGLDSVPIDIKTQLGGEGRAVLTSSSATEPSYEKDGAGIYTHYIVDGIESGAADTDNNGVITVAELHEYAQSKTQLANRKMQPKFFPVKEGYTIQLAKAPIGDNKLAYRKEIERWVQLRQGNFSNILLNAFEEKRKKLDLSPEEAKEIMAEVLQPKEDFENKRLLYERSYTEATRLDFPITQEIREELRYLQLTLGLRDTDVTPIEEKFNNREFKNASAYFDRGLKNYDIKNYEGAIRNYTEAIKLKPDYSVAYFNLGLAYYYSRKDEEAVEAFTQAINTNHDWGTVGLADAYLQRGIAYYALNNMDAAIEDYAQSLQHETNSSLIYYERGFAYFSLKNYEAAIQDYTQAIEINSKTYELDDATTYVQRGLAYYRSNNKDAALEDWKQASVLKPNYSLAFYNIGIVHDNNEDYQAAIENYTQAIAANNEWGASLKLSDAYYRRGLSQYKLRQFEASIEDYTQAIEIESEFDLAYEKRGDAYYDLGNKELAIENYRQAENLYSRLFRTVEYQTIRRKIRDLEQ